MNRLVIALCSVMAAASSCKSVKTTKAPVGGQPSGATSGDAIGQNGNVITSSDVPFTEVPRVTITVDVSDCVGSSRWLDPAYPASARLGAISVTPTKLDGNVDSQPIPWIFEPTRASSDAAAKSSGSSAWRLQRGSYSVDLVAYNAKSSATESSLSKPFDFSTTNDLTLSVVGRWDSDKSVCVLSWK